MFRDRILFLLLLSVVTAGTAHALPKDSEQEIQLSADSQLVDRQRGIATYQGNVQIIRGGMEMHGDELVLEFDDDELVGATMKGAPVRFSQRHDERAATEAEARELVYDVVAGEVRLRGSVRVRQAGNEFASEDLRYDVDSERIVAAGESDSRIRVTIQPRKPEPEPEP